MKHTPGPWRVARPFPGSDTRLTVSVYDEEFDCTTVHICNVFSGNNEEANARLIAAAPELLEMLKKYVAVGEMGKAASFATQGQGADGYTKLYNYESLYNETKSVIAKAEGR